MPKAERIRLLADIGLSVLFASVFFLVWPVDTIYDDGAIILKYMDNFAGGHFYCYNPADGPVYGISGFVHGVLAGLLAYTHVFSPLNSLFASNFIGLMLVSLVSLRILRHLIPDSRLVHPSWLLLMISSPNFIGTVKQGLETPLHVGVVLCCFLCFLRNCPRLMWLSFVLAMISKLDAVPVVAVLAALFAVRLYRSKTPVATGRHLRLFLLYGVIPGLAWLAFALVVFGSPVPQTLVAKFFYHGHATGGWFPFFSNWYAYMGPMIVVATVAFLGYAAASQFLRDVPSPLIVLSFGLAATACLGLFLLYNPGEQMPWYYALPEFLLILQTIAVAMILISRALKRRTVAVGFSVLLALALCFLPLARRRLMAIFGWLRRVEPELVAVGRWVGAHSAPTETLMVALGHVARESGLYTIDLSGLNSPAVTDCCRTKRNVFLEFHPDWIVLHGLLQPADQVHGGYSLVNSYYRIAALRAQHALRVYHRLPPGRQPLMAVVALEKKSVATDGSVPSETILTAEGTRIAFDNPLPQAPDHLLVCVFKEKEVVEVKASVQDADGTSMREQVFRVAAADPQDAVHGFTQECRIATDLPERTARVVVTAVSERTKTPIRITAVEPVFLFAAGTLVQFDVARKGLFEQRLIIR